MLDQPSSTKSTESAPDERPQQGGHGIDPGDGDIISDSEFMEGVEQLKALRSFLLKQAVPCKSEGPMFFGKPNNLRRAKKKAEGRVANDEEWILFELNLPMNSTAI
jgi:hypothetical protein